jgi:hypothetical protein
MAAVVAVALRHVVADDDLLAAGGGGEAEVLRKINDEVQALVDTCLDGAAVFAWQENAQGTGYEALVLPGPTKARNLDTVLSRIAVEIERIRDEAGGKTPPPEVTATRTVDPALIARIQPDAPDG